MGLGGMLNSGDYVTFNQLMRELTDNSQSYSYQMKSWVKNRGMPIHTKRECVQLPCGLSGGILGMGREASELH